MSKKFFFMPKRINQFFGASELAILPPDWIISAWIWPIPDDLYLFNLSIALSTSKRRLWWLSCCIFFCLMSSVPVALNRWKSNYSSCSKCCGNLHADHILLFRVISRLVSLLKFVSASKSLIFVFLLIVT